MSLVKLAPKHVGWKRDGGVVASARFDRDGEVMAVAELEYDDLESACALFDAVVGAVTASRLVGTSDVLGRCGFEQVSGQWVREVRPETVPPRFVTLSRLEAAIRAAWGRDTTEEPDVWTDTNPAWGNCAVTALVVRDYLGGEIVVAGVVRNGVRIDRHAWNRLPSGLEVDLSRDQFTGDEEFEAPELVDDFVAEDTEERYAILAARVRAALDRA